MRSTSNRWKANTPEVYGRGGYYGRHAFLGGGKSGLAGLGEFFCVDSYKGVVGFGDFGGEIVRN